MEAHGHFGKIGSRRSGQSLSNRRTSVLIAVVCAVLAAVLIYVFVSHNKNTAAPAVPAQATVLVATKYIPSGVPASTVVSGGLLKPEQVPVTQAVAGAIADSSVISGRGLRCADRGRSADHRHRLQP